MLETIEVQTAGQPDCSVIWLHGLGADGHDFEPLVPELRLDGVRSVRFIFPHAPVRPVTVNGGMPMRAWFDVYGLERDLRVDEAGIVGAQQQVCELIAREQARGIPASRIALAGFSQGGSLAMTTGLIHGERLAGLIGLSCWIPKNFAALSTAQAATPIFLAHGSVDPVVPVSYGRASRDALQSAGADVTYREYAMAHQVCGTEIADLREFFLAIFPPSI